MKNCETINECIACGHDKLIPVLDLKSQPLANSFKKTRNEYEEYFPLAINRCEKCFHVQLTHKVNPDLLFKDYLYVSGTSKTQLDYFKWFVGWTMEQQNIKNSNVLDIGCNDGSLLDTYKSIGMNTYGVDPAENLYEISSKNHKVLCDYFNECTNDKFTVDFDIITCLNAFAHNYNPLQFLENIGKLMKDNTRLYITTSQADMILNNEFDTIYHEHISFYNIKSMNELCRRAGLNLIDVITHPIHGTSYIFVISKYEKRENHINNQIELEAKFGLYDSKTYFNYAKDCKHIIDNFQYTINRLRGDGAVIIGYGAPAKGNTLMNAALAAPDFIIDDNPLKQGLYTPGISIPVYGSEWLDKYSDVDNIVFVPLAWNFFDEIKQKITEKRNGKNDAFLRYFPNLGLEPSTNNVMHHPV